MNRPLNITPDVVARRRGPSRTRRTARGSPDIFISLHLPGDAGERRPRARGRTGCRPGRPTARGIAFTSDPRRQPGDLRDEPRRLERAPAHEPPGDRLTPTWSPTGTQIAFTSDRIGLAADLRGRGRRPRPRGRSRASRTATGRRGRRRRTTRSRTRRGRARATTSRSSTCRRGEVRQMTFGEGSNESPAYSPNGRHLAFMSTRTGKQQIFTIVRRRQGPAADHHGRATTSRPTGRSRARPRALAWTFHCERSDDAHPMGLSGLVVCWRWCSWARAPRRSRRWPGRFPRRRPTEETPVTPAKPPAPPEPVPREKPAPEPMKRGRDCFPVARRPEPGLAAASRSSSATTAPRCRPRARPCCRRTPRC